jgi:tetratricopeptide (TPR) repeat protein
MAADAELHLRLGRTLIRLGDESAGARELAIARDAAPDVYSRLTPAELALSEQSRPEEEDMLTRARQALLAGNYRGAIELYERAAEASPDDPSLHYEWATALAGVQDLRAAAVHFERALQLAPDFAAAHNDLGQLLTGVGDFDLAIEHYRAAIAVKPDMISAHYNLATTQAAAGRIQEAVVAMENCLAIARRGATADVVARIEDRLSRLQKELAGTRSRNQP